MNSNRSECGKIREQLALLIYGELSFDEEETVESHLATCQACTKALAEERELLSVCDQVAIEPSPALLAQCRANLTERLAMEPVVKRTWWDGVMNALSLHPPAGFPASSFHWARPAGAFAMLVAGFLGARLAPNFGAGLIPGVTDMGLVPGMSTVRSVEKTPDGKLQIVLDETHQRVISGQWEDAQIRQLILQASTDLSNPVRTETVAILAGNAQASEVREALIYALRHDDNAGVRLKALAGLASFAQEPRVRKTLAEVVLADTNPGVRTQSIDLLIQGLADEEAPALDTQMIGVLQELMSREQNPYLRQRCQRALELANASTEIF